MHAKIGIMLIIIWVCSKTGYTPNGLFEWGKLWYAMNLRVSSSSRQINKSNHHIHQNLPSGELT